MINVSKPEDTAADVFARVAPHIKVIPRSQESSGAVPLNNYKAWLNKVGWSSPFPYFAYELKIVNSCSDTEFRKLLTDALSRWVTDERIHLRAPVMGDDGFDVKNIARNVLDLIIILGPKEAAATLIANLSDEYVEYDEIILVDGLTVSEDMPIADGAKLDLLSIHNTQVHSDNRVSDGFWQPSRFESDTRDGDTRAVLILDKKCLRFMKLTPDDSYACFRERFELIYRSTRYPQFDTDVFLKWLSITTRTRLLDWYVWHNATRPDIATPRWTWGSRGRVHSYRSIDPYQPTRDELKAAIFWHDKLLSAKPGVRDKLNTPLRRLADSMGRKGAADKVIDIAITLECLYLDDVQQDLSYRLQTRAARLLCDDRAG